MPMTEAAISLSQSKYSARSMEGQIPSPLWLATSQGFLAGIDFLIDHKVDERDIAICAEYASSTKKMEVLQHLVQHSADVLRHVLAGYPSYDANYGTEGRPDFALEEFCKSPVWKADQVVIFCDFAIKRGNEELQRLMFEKLESFGDQGKDNKSKMLKPVLKAAVLNEDLEAIKILYNAGLSLSETVETDVWSFFRDGLNEEEKLELPQSTGVAYSILHLAVALRLTGMVLYLLEKDVSPTSIDPLGMTPLHYVVHESGGLDILSFLLSSGADAEAQDSLGRTPLHIAAHFNSTYAIKSLLNAGATVDTRDFKGRTPLHHCAYDAFGDWPSSTRMLLTRYGASEELDDDDGYSAIELAFLTAIRQCYTIILQSILARHPLLVKSKFPPLDRTALHFAAEADATPEVIDILRSAGAPLEAVDKEGKTYLEISPITRRVELPVYLFSYINHH
jgi:ankyrin repeat protein